MSSAADDRVEGDSIALRLRREIAGTLALLSATTFLALFWLVAHELEQAFDRSLAVELHALRSAVVLRANAASEPSVDHEEMDADTEGRERYFQLSDVQNPELIYRSQSLRTTGFSFAAPQADASNNQPWQERLPDGRLIRALASTATLKLADHGEENMQVRGAAETHRQVRMVVGRPRDELDRSVARLALACAVGAIMIPLLSSLALRILVSRALSPLHQLAELASDRREDDVRPLRLYACLEVDPIVSRINLLFGRIAEARKHERAFIAHAAHELRTPLAEMLALADVAEMEKTVLEAQYEAVASMRHSALRMARLVDAFFSLARHDPTRQQAAKQLDRSKLLRLEDEFASALAGQRRESDDRGLRWCVSVTGEVNVHADPVLLRALLDNLVANVVAHAPERSQVNVSISGDGVPGFRMANAVDLDSRSRGEHLGYGLVIAGLYAEALRVALSRRLEDRQFEVRLQWMSRSAVDRRSGAEIRE